MSVDWWDSMGDAYATGDVTAMGWSATPNSFQTGRLAGSCYRINNTSKTHAVGVGPSRTTGWAWRCTVATGTRNLFSYFEGGTEHLRVTYNGDGTFSVSRAGTALAGPSAAVILSAGAWYTIEFSGTIHDTTGAFELKVNGTTILSASGVDTRNGGTSGTINTIQIVAGTASNDDWDDMWSANAAGEFYGDLRVCEAVPNSDGGASQWTPSTGTAHYACVDDATPGGDTDYVSDSTVGHRDTYGFPSLPVGSGGTVVGVSVRMWARKDDAGTRTIDGVARISGTNYDNGSALALGAAYAPSEARWLTNPATGTAWTVSQVNGAELGVKEVA